MNIAARLEAVRAEIAAACARHGRDPEAVTLLAVSKTRPAASVRAALAAGQRAFGENRVQELVAKAAELRDPSLEWHMIGSLQTNKVRDVLRVSGLTLLHSLDRIKLADHLQQECAIADRDLRVLVQLNASGENEKHGVAPENARALARHVAAHCPRLQVCGVMAMGPRSGAPDAAFALASRTLEQLRDDLGRSMPTLSLGMTHDLDAAIAAGSTMVRVGTGVFGQRDPA